MRARARGGLRGEPDSAERRRREAAPAPGELRVELVFGAGADLDLYVTDPAQETVYFANTPLAGSGGRLEADLRCDAAATPRIETVVFASAPPGRYRVGVDRAGTCEAGGSAAERFLVTVEFGRAAARGARRDPARALPADRARDRPAGRRSLIQSSSPDMARERRLKNEAPRAVRPGAP